MMVSLGNMCQSVRKTHQMPTAPSIDLSPISQFSVITENTKASKNAYLPLLPNGLNFILRQEGVPILTHPRCYLRLVLKIPT